jgi:transcriptional regulator GlxA family with amidase domain
VTTYGILVFDDAEELDFAGPQQVFGVSTAIQSSGNTITLAKSKSPLRCRRGLEIRAHHTFSNHPPLDVLLVPGGRGARVAANDGATINWISATAPHSTWITSVCTGVRVLYAAGVVTNRRVATHWSYEDELASHPDITVVRDARWVRDGNVVTSQGVSAGIDLALWLVGHLAGRAHALQVQHYMQYHPAPPYAAEV